jgi:WD40 repeat protein
MGVATAFRSYGVASGAKTLDFSVGAKWCEDVQYSPNGAQVATLTEDGICFWDATSGRLHGSLRPPTMVVSMSFSRCGHALVAIDEKHVVRVWDVATGTQRTQLAAEPGTARVTLSADALLALIIDSEGTLRIWDVMTGRQWTQSPAVARVDVVALSHDRTLLAVATRRSVGIWPIGPASAAVIGAPPQVGSCAWCGAS